jgi:hypothetical protein
MNRSLTLVLAPLWLATAAQAAKNSGTIGARGDINPQTDSPHS